MNVAHRLLDISQIHDRMTGIMDVADLVSRTRFQVAVADRTRIRREWDDYAPHTDPYSRLYFVREGHASLVPVVYHSRNPSKEVSYKHYPDLIEMAKASMIPASWLSPSPSVVYRNSGVSLIAWVSQPNTSRCVSTSISRRVREIVE